MSFFKGKRAKHLVKSISDRLGFEIVRVAPVARGPIASAMLAKRAIPVLEQIVASSSEIPGMLSEESAKNLYLLCASQLLKGDVVEIGSWQGYSTSFLASAVRDSGNGEMFAIDHFHGNEGTQDYYVVGESDLSDLRGNFQRNMESAGVWDVVNLLDMPNSEAAGQLAGRSVRFLFIDGDHTRKGVESDISLFFPMLKSGSMVVFDDFSDEARGVIEAVDALLEKKPVSRIFSYPNTLVMILG